MTASLRQRFLGSRRGTLLGIGIAAAICAWLLGLDPRRLVEGNSLKLAGEFLAAAFRPALDYESPVDGAPPFLLVAVQSVLITLRFALLAMTVAVPCAIILTFFSTTAWWPNRSVPLWLKAALRGTYIVTRAVIAFARSIHELIWGLLFITAVGLSSEAGVIAVAIPFSGILAKIYAEMLEEHARDSQEALEAIGAGSFPAFVFGLVPRALPDLVSYTFYRLECALRTAAVFGFIGIETIGYRIKLASDEFHYREIWTYLYLLFAAIALIEWWGASIRKRLRD
ncbi:MAG: ABC transporter permease subunit [Verrucomicrobiae bacterium]|nr:ABC transporter permease subunit [Verrucomicrobiae bacterium]